MINVAYQLIADNSCTDQDGFLRLETFLNENFGIKINQKKVFDRSKKINWTFGLSKVAQVAGSTESEIETGSYLDYLDSLEEVILSLGQSTSSKFTIFYDDLDDGFEGSEVYCNSMCSLIYAVDDLNRSFLRSGFNAKCILLLRSDIFRVLNSPDLNKYKMDNSLKLDWEPEERENSPLFHLIIHRIITALKLSHTIDKKDYNKVFYELFEDKISGKRTTLWILDRTFARPRDIVQLLKIAGNEFPSFNKYTPYALTKTHGLYSQYLYDDVRNEMKGHKDSDFVERSLSLLKGIGKGNTISIEQIKSKKPYLFSNPDGIEDVKEMLKFLYRFSVIGNIYHNSDVPSQIESYSWSHREDQAEPDFDAKFTIHQGIRAALKVESKSENVERTTAYHNNFKSLLDDELENEGVESPLLPELPNSSLQVGILVCVYKQNKPVSISDISKNISSLNLGVINNEALEKSVNKMVKKKMIKTIENESKQLYSKI